MTTLYRIFILTAFIFTAAHASAAALPQDMLLLPPDGWVTNRAGVPFSHELHDADGTVACVTCHHEWDGEGEPLGCASEGCHVSESRRDPMSFYGAFHDRNSERSCVGCHRTAQRESDARPPVSCNGCHVPQ